MFYKATVQAVLLFESETWNLTPTLTKQLKGFHIRATYRMTRTDKSWRSPNGERTYPSSEDMSEEVGMHTIASYIEVQRKMTVAFIINWPIFSFCKGGEQRHGTSPSQFWWEHSI